HHDDAFGRRRAYVDIIDADAGASDHLEVVSACKDFRRHLSGGAHREAVEFAYDDRELVLVLAGIGVEIHVNATVPENLNGRRRESVGDENARSHVLPVGFIADLIASKSPWSSPGLSRRPRKSWHGATLIGVAGTSPATTPEK